LADRADLDYGVRVRSNAPGTGGGPSTGGSPSTGGAATRELEKRMDNVVREFAREPRFKGQTEQQVRDRIEFVAGNVIFATAHEVGHMLIADLGLPVLGREEDAADAFAC
jgi:hypothetical protein